MNYLQGSPILPVLARNWWALVLRGVVAVIFGIVAWIWPGLTVTALVVLFGAYALVDGIFAVVAAIMAAGRGERWGMLMVEGILSALLGVVTWIWPGLTALGLIYLIGAWAIVTGVSEIAAAIQLRKVISGELFLGLAGLASIIFGLYVLVFPGSGAIAIVWLIAIYAILFGVLLVALGFRLRGFKETDAGGGTGVPPTRAAM